jgi:hypothetical protein
MIAATTLVAFALFPPFALFSRRFWFGIRQAVRSPRLGGTTEIPMHREYDKKNDEPQCQRHADDQNRPSQ